MNDFDFKQIAARKGSQHDAFEEVCCQLARREVAEGATFVRLHGAGGDGGVECFSDLADGARVGWQAKFVFNVDSLISQVTKSLATALEVHPALTRYVVCFPFDLTGPTGRGGRSGQEKFAEWRDAAQQEAAKRNRQLKIEEWSASKLTALLLDHDPSGGMREFFFNSTVLSQTWFATHLQEAFAAAGPRYTPKLNIETELWQWFAALGRTADWRHALDASVRVCLKALENLASAVQTTAPGRLTPVWPSELRDDGAILVEKLRAVLHDCIGLTETHDQSKHADCASILDALVGRTAALEVQLSSNLEAQYGRGRADSPGFRQFMAEYEVQFPAANLDYLREVKSACSQLHAWLESPAGSLSFQRALVITGTAGAGKTHGICDAAERRLHEGLLTLVVFGHMFGGEPDPWSRLLESLALPIALGREGLLDALESAAEASESTLLFCIDAVNETRPLRYWHDRLAAVVQAVRTRPHLRLCVTCRTSYLSQCLPQNHALPVVEHRGFVGQERIAAKAFFEYYGLGPPIDPILQPEFSNPLYLRLVCETLQARGLDHLPRGWRGIAPTMKAFLQEKEQQFAHDHGTNAGEDIVGGSLRAIAAGIVTSGESTLPWSQASAVVSVARPQASGLHVVEWLIGADLLIEEGSTGDAVLGDENVVRPAFERFGDFLIGAEMLARVTTVDQAFLPGGLFEDLVQDSDTVATNYGLLTALSVLIPEQESGKELPFLISDSVSRSLVLKLTIEAFAWRDPTTFSLASRSLVVEAFGTTELWRDALDAVVALSWYPSVIDATWIDFVLKETPLAKRDAWWCSYLHDSWTSQGPVRRLIEAAFELPLDSIEEDVAERWATMLLWFTASADRRVKDWATRAAVALLAAHPHVMIAVLERFLSCDDDEVRERVLVGCYGALILSRDADVLREMVSILERRLKGDPIAFDNALIRDNIRAIAELAIMLGVLANGVDAEAAMNPTGSAWPLELPSEEEVQQWTGNRRALPRLAASCLNDDFFIYSMECLRPWWHEVPKVDCASWILQKVVRDFGYEGSGAEQYDAWMLAEYGGGRSKPTWAERIGKKYQWLAMYQLASRLNDHADRERDDWAPSPLRRPPILLEERTFDPTLAWDTIGYQGRGEGESAWIKSSADLGLESDVSDEEWVNKQDDLPKLDDLLSVIEIEQQEWLLLAATPSWGGPDEDAKIEEQFRQVWIHIDSYLIPRRHMNVAYKTLDRRNFFGLWMPENAIRHYGFAGEYPWATPFNLEPDEWPGSEGRVGDPPISVMPSSNRLSVEWNYDASLDRRSPVLVPARSFFAPGDLWWNGRDGYANVGGRTVFRDPSTIMGGASSLLADASDLVHRLDEMGCGLIWTLLGEKWILGGFPNGATARRTFSQIARLEKDGSVTVGRRAFFDDYTKDAGPRRVSRGNRRKRA